LNLLPLLLVSLAFGATITPDKETDQKTLRANLEALQRGIRRSSLQQGGTSYNDVVFKDDVEIQGSLSVGGDLTITGTFSTAHSTYMVVDIDPGTSITNSSDLSVCNSTVTISATCTEIFVWFDGSLNYPSNTGTLATGILINGDYPSGYDKDTAFKAVQEPSSTNVDLNASFYRLLTGVTSGTKDVCLTIDNASTSAEFGGAGHNVKSQFGVRCFQ